MGGGQPVGVLQAGTKENVIPDDAIIKLTVRTFDAGVRKHVLRRSNGSSMPRPKPRAREAGEIHAVLTATRST